MKSGWLSRKVQEKVLGREFDEYFRILGLIFPNITSLLIKCREQGIPILYSCLGYFPPQEPSEFQRATGWDWDLSGPLGTFPEEWTPTKSDKVFAKPGWSALSNPGLREWVVTSNIDTVMIAGTMFEFGIRQTCVDLGDNGIGSLILSDGVAALTQDSQEYTANSIAHGLIKLRNTAETINLLSTLNQTGQVRI